ncbi:MAG: hypothetical protein DRO10_03420 [Thermoprotei archaeon]|nr:MAG: hypothetical protein DRO10_03420 [Thermoprotei archaeon]HDN18313.1 hypothetical protein [Candidatus Bathyarchaeota archaeon]
MASLKRIPLEISSTEDIRRCCMKLRLRNILREDGKAVVVAADHGLMIGPFVKGVVGFRGTLERVLKGEPDAVLLSPGMVKKYGYLFTRRTGIIMRLDWTNIFRSAEYVPLTPRTPVHIKLGSVLDAMKMGVDGVLVYFFLGYSDDVYESRDYKLVHEVARECEEYGMPFIVEPLPRGPRVTGANFPDLVALGVRMAVEAGADLLKVPYTQDIETFQGVVDAAEGVPILILGGARGVTDMEPLDMLHEAMQIGVNGVVYGRNVIESPDPTKTLRMIHGIVHEGLTPKEALDKYGEEK